MECGMMSKTCQTCKYAKLYEKQDVQKYLDEQFAMHGDNRLATVTMHIFSNAEKIRFRNTHVACSRYPKEEYPALDYSCGEYVRKK